jgi:hypothetical protein
MPLGSGEFDHRLGGRFFADAYLGDKKDAQAADYR